MIFGLKPGVVITALFLALLVCFLCYFGSMQWLSVKRLKLDFESLPDGFAGYKILHISDLHSNHKSDMNVDIWREIEMLEFDVAMITGDVVVGGFDEILAHGEEIKRLAERVPVYFVDGNHEKKIYDRVKEYLESLGVTVLGNESVKLERNGDEITLIGTRDYQYLEKNDFEGNISVISEMTAVEGFKIVLQHEPQLFDLLNKTDELLMLCGHTHGGQVRFPLLPTLYAPGQGFLPKYSNGLYTEGKAVMYVSKGIGTTVFPIRFYNRPEIAVIELEKRVSGQ